MGYKPKMTLLYRVSEHGDKKDTYWEKVNGMENTLLFVRSK